MWNDGQRNRGLDRRREKQSEHDARVLPRIAALRGLGLSDRRIADLLQLDGYPPPRVKWSHMAVLRIRKRHGLL